MQTGAVLQSLSYSSSKLAVVSNDKIMSYINAVKESGFLVIIDTQLYAFDRDDYFQLSLSRFF